MHSCGNCVQLPSQDARQLEGLTRQSEGTHQMDGTRHSDGRPVNRMKPITRMGGPAIGWVPIIWMGAHHLDGVPSFGWCTISRMEPVTRMGGPAIGWAPIFSIVVIVWTGREEKLMSVIAHLILVTNGGDCLSVLLLLRRFWSIYILPNSLTSERCEITIENTVVQLIIT